MDNKTLELCLTKINQAISSSSDEWETISNIEYSIHELKEEFLNKNGNPLVTDIVQEFVTKIEQAISISSDEWETISNVNNCLEKMEKQIFSNKKSNKP